MSFVVPEVIAMCLGLREGVAQAPAVVAEYAVRGTTGGGGIELAGCPSASRNFRIRSASDSAVHASNWSRSLWRRRFRWRFVWLLFAFAQRFRQQLKQSRYSDQQEEK